jgi:hypothetical protein
VLRRAASDFDERFLKYIRCVNPRFDPRVGSQNHHSFQAWAKVLKRVRKRCLVAGGSEAGQFFDCGIACRHTGILTLQAVPFRSQIRMEAEQRAR